MSSAQASVVPVVGNNTLETVTLKNIVALDLVEQNEAVLSAFQLIESTSRSALPMTRTKEELLQRIAEKNKELEEATQEAQDAKSTTTTDPLSGVVDSLAAEFLKDTVSHEDVDALIAQFEKENGVRVVHKTRDETHRVVDGSKLKGMAEALESKREEEAGANGKDADGDVEVK